MRLELKEVLILLWKQGVLSVLKKSRSRPFMKDDGDDECSQIGQWRWWWRLGVFANRLYQAHTFASMYERRNRLRYVGNAQSNSVTRGRRSQPFRRKYGWDCLDVILRDRLDRIMPNDRNLTRTLFAFPGFAPQKHHLQNVMNRAIVANSTSTYRSRHLPINNLRDWNFWPTSKLYFKVSAG